MPEVVWLVIVSGDEVVTARCEECGRYFNPREFNRVGPGGRKDTYSGTCEKCAKVGAAFQLESPKSVA